MLSLKMLDIRLFSSIFLPRVCVEPFLDCVRDVTRDVGTMLFEHGNIELARYRDGS